MPKRMAMVFNDEGLYIALKREAVRRGRHAEDIVAEAVRDWLEAKEDEDLHQDLDEAREEWQREGGVEAGKFFTESLCLDNDSSICTYGL
ncbi:MAG: hypothetical protein EXR50_04770 [Dehalococcoidia bacterium]|nr:hypothetical protein [Dehalococcoidia bacterium]